jgi:trehalose 6-phosphate synthase
MSRTIVVSNRVPVPARSGPEQAQAGGLAVVMRDSLEERGGIWFGWSGEVVAEPAVTPRLVTKGNVTFATIDLSKREHEGYYSGFANGVLWPLMHLMPHLVQYRREDAEIYRQVNERMADALVPLLKPDDTIWVQDYHLLALPAELRARGVRQPIGFFLHIPFPGADMLSTVPGMERLVRGMLAADLVGMQTTRDVCNFIAAACQIGQAREIEPGVLRAGGCMVRVGAFPVEIEPEPFAALAIKAVRADPARRMKASLIGQSLILGVDRLDPSKGLAERLEAFGRLLERKPEWRGRASMLQIAAASRQDVASYRNLRREIEAIAGRINAAYGEADWTPVRLVTRAVKRDTIAGYMRMARVCLVTSLRDGMNVVAKEYVAAQDAADPGVLVLSRFAGAAEQLKDALLVNPNDPEALTDVLDGALRMDLTARKQHWARLWGNLLQRSARDWGTEFLAALEEAGAERHAKLGQRAAKEITLMPPALRLSGPPINLPASARQH